MNPPHAPEVSVIVPVLNEESVLPRLLASLARQEGPAWELVVVDGRSTDRSREVVRRWAARLPAVVLLVATRRGVAHQKNLGAAAARGRWLLFLDADTELPAGFLSAAVGEAAARALNSAAPLSDPVESGVLPRMVFTAFNVWMRLARVVAPHAPGYCQLFTRSLFSAVGGFDESLKLCEEMEILARARRRGRFGILSTVRVRASARRFERHGYLRTALQQLGILLHRLILGEIRTARFRYPFNPDRAAFEPRPVGPASPLRSAPQRPRAPRNPGNGTTEPWRNGPSGGAGPAPPQP